MKLVLKNISQILRNSTPIIFCNAVTLCNCTTKKTGLDLHNFLFLCLRAFPLEFRFLPQSIEMHADRTRREYLLVHLCCHAMKQPLIQGGALPPSPGKLLDSAATLSVMEAD